VRREVNILRTLDHPNICRLYETFEGRRSVCMVLEYVDGEELFEYIQEVAAAVEAGSLAIAMPSLARWAASF